MSSELDSFRVRSGHHRGVAFATVRVAIAALWPMVACGSSGDRDNGQGGDHADSSVPSIGDLGRVDGGDGGMVELGRDPIDCEEAKTSKSYVGCDYWPTVTPNFVQDYFDYVVVVANTGTNEASVTVTGPQSVNKQVTVAPGRLKKIYLPWVPELKDPSPADLVSKGGAYHLVSSRPVIAYQFNALEYVAEGGEAPDGGPKEWPVSCKSDPCYSFTNDASLLLPSTAMTGNYRVTGLNENGVLSITATAPGTTAKIILSPTAAVAGGTGIAQTSGGGTLTISLTNAGDVAQVLAEDFSGSVVQADKPVQVISSKPCTNVKGFGPCDHIEETVMPAETLGKHYFVGTPTGPKGTAAKHLVRFYGNRDNTSLTYSPSKPAGCPEKLDAGQMTECEIVTDSFEVTGDQEFAIAAFLLGASAYKDIDNLGDPSQTTYPSLEQYRTRYVFLAPDDYPVRWADVIGTEDAAMDLDGTPVAAPWTKIGAGPYGTFRLDLTKSGKDGAHVLTAAKPVAVQVIGYGKHTSFHYPAGLNLKLIAPPPAGPK